MSYFPPHFMMAGRQDMPENLVANGASAYAAAAKHVSNPWWLNYDQALDLQAPQQHKPMHLPQITVSHLDRLHAMVPLPTYDVVVDDGASSQ